MNVGTVFKQPHLLWLWISQLLSVIGDHLFTVALTWIAVQQVGSSAALVSAAGMGTAMLLGLIGGAFADRWNRRMTMISVDLLRALIVGLLPLIDHFSDLQLWHFIVVIVLVEALGTLYDPALQASLPEVCGDPQVLQTTNALFDGTHRLARVLGPGLTGAFLLVLALPQFFLVDALTFLFSALVLLFLKPAFPKPLPRSPERNLEKHSLLADIGESLRLLRGHKTLCWALVSLGLVNISWSAVYLTGIPMLAAHQLSANIGAYGVIVGAYGIGNLVSLFVLSMLPFRMNILMMFIGHLILGIGFLLLSTSSTLGVAIFATALAAFGSPMGDLIMLNMIQSDFPTAHIGKIYSLRRLISGMGLLVGSLMAVPVFKWVAIPLGIQMFTGLIFVVGVVGVIRFAARSRLDTKIPQKNHSSEGVR